MFNFYPINLVMLIVLMIPSVIFFSKQENKEKYQKEYKPFWEEVESVARYATMFFYVVKVEESRTDSLLSYLIPLTFLVLYILVWIIMRKVGSLLRSILLSVLPSLMFISSAIIDKNYILLSFAILFAICHITVSVKDALN